MLIQIVRRYRWHGGHGGHGRQIQIRCRPKAWTIPIINQRSSSSGYGRCRSGRSAGWKFGRRFCCLVKCEIDGRSRWRFRWLHQWRCRKWWHVRCYAYCNISVFLFANFRWPTCAFKSRWRCFRDVVFGVLFVAVRTFAVAAHRMIIVHWMVCWRWWWWRWWCNCRWCYGWWSHSFATSSVEHGLNVFPGEDNLIRRGACQVNMPAPRIEVCGVRLSVLWVR